MKKRIISLLLAVIMVVGLVPMTALAEEAAVCIHAATTETVVGNGNGTHNKTVTCDDCGEAVVQDTVTIDFKSDFAAASEEDFWDSLTTTTLANGGEVKRVGTIYNGVQEEGNADAFASLNEWLAENKGWSFDETTTAHLTGAKGTGQKLYFNTDDDALWGLGYNGYYIAMSDGRSSMGLTVQVDEAGTYDLSADIVLSVNGSTDYDAGYTADGKQIADSGGAMNVHVIVNGETVATGISTKGSTALTTVEIGEVELDKGENSIVFYVATNYWDATNSAFRSNVNLAGLTMAQTAATVECEAEDTLTFNEADKTHTLTKLCECGAYILPAPDRKDISMDFKAVAKEMAKQDFWSALPSFTMANGAEARYVGGKYGSSLTAEQAAAYDSLLAWLDETYGWTVDDGFATFKSSSGGRLIFCADDSVAWGFSHNSYYTNFASDLRDGLGFTVYAPKAGWYRMDIGLSLSNSSATDCISGEGGGAYETFTVNGEEVYAHLGNVGANAVVDYALGAVYLNEGENTLGMKMVANYWNQNNAAYRTNFNMIGIELTEVGTYLLPGQTATVDANDYVNFETVLSADSNTVAVSGAVASAAIDENGDLTVTAGEEVGEGSVTVSTADAEIFTAAVKVATSMDYDCTDENGDGKCDVCSGKIGECVHKTVNTTVTSNGDETHTTEAVCALCDANILMKEEALNVIKVDFTEFAKQAAEQDFWAELPDAATVSGAAVKRIGVTYDTNAEDAMPAEENAAYEALIKWQQETLGWSFNESLMDVEYEDGNMIFISNAEALKWGVLRHSYFYNFEDHRSDMALTVIADKAGYYQLDLSYVPQGSTATDYPSYASVGAGGGYADIFVNGELVIDQFSFKCDNTQNNKLHAANLATVYLEAGGNDIVIRNAANYHNSCTNGAYTGRGNVALSDLTFTEIDTPELIEGSITVPMTDVVGDTLDLTSFAVIGSDDGVATAVLDDNGDILVTAVADGKAEFTVTTAAAEGQTASVVGKLCVEVGDTVTSNCWDADGDEACDVCGGAVACKHPYTHRMIVSNGDGTHNVFMACDLCDAPVTVPEVLPCEDKNEGSDGICDWCGEAFTCLHTLTTVSYVDNGDGTHEKTVTCKLCNAVMSEPVVEDCADEDGDGYCDGCEAVVETEPECDHANTTTETVDNGDKTHTTTVTCECGEVVSTETADCADEDKDTLCDVCGGTYVTIKKFSMAGSNMTLGNELEVNFLFLKKNLTETDCTAIVTHYMADGTTKVTEIPQADWSMMGTTYHKVSTRIAAKEMADTLTIEIVDADGYVLNNEYSDSARGYAGRALASSSTTQYVRIMMIDMLNYGAAAQEHFKYNTSDLANNALTEEQQALATAKITCTNGQVKDATIYGSNLSLEDSILLNTFFKGLKGKDIASMYAMVNFTDFEGKAKEVRMEGSEFEKYGSSGDIYKIVVDDVVLADAKQLVTVTLYNADGTVFGAGTDSVESYVARAESNNADTYGLYANIMKFATSAYNYIINK